jgi:CheY-like chemotaxis protein
MDGFAATQAIRDQEKEKSRRRTPIIGMTAHALVDDKDKCIAVGMDSYFSKPLVEADLKRQILKYLKTEQKAA